MLDVLELEKEWKHYHRKKRMPLYISSIIVIVLATAASYVYLYKPELITTLMTQVKQVTQAAKTQEPLPSKVVAVQPVNVIQTKPASTETTQNVLKPSFTFLYNLEDQVISYNNAKLLAMAAATKQESQPKPAEKRVSKPKKESKPVPRKKVEKPKPAPKPVPVKTVKKDAVKSPPVEKKIVTTALITKSEPVENEEQEEALVKVHHDEVSTDELNSVIKRFNKQKKPALSLFIAKKYYELGKYKEAYNYALITNKLNPNIEESILIFARSLVKLGQKEDAINTLQSYIKKSGSFKAKILLSDIEKGNFT